MDIRGTDEGFTVSVAVEGVRAAVELVGELDLNGSEQLEAELSKLPYGRIEGVDLDAGRLTFIDSAGLRALLVCRDACRRRGVEFRLTSVSPTVGRIVAIAGVDDVLPGDG
jgi:anti-anti-sigma factor